jgi:hypothetical protein
MKKVLFVAISLLVVVGIIGCSKNRAYDSEEAIKRGDVVYQNKVVNLERFEEFLINISNKKEDTIRVTGYTDEGDPIFKDLQFDGKVIHFTYDNTNDKFAGDKGIEEDDCTGIIKEESEPGKIYFLISGCSKGNDRFLIRVEKDKLKLQ